MKDIKYIIADNVKLYRKKQNLTQFELAEKAELSVDSIKRIEHGSRTMSLENFARIADALVVPLSYLLYENLNEIPITERILNILNSKGVNQQKYLVSMLEEMSPGLDKLYSIYKKDEKGVQGILCAFFGKKIVVRKFIRAVKIFPFFAKK